MHLCLRVLAPRTPGTAPWQRVHQKTMCSSGPSMTTSTRDRARLSTTTLLSSREEARNTPLNYSQFERELRNHPDKSCLLHSIQHMVALGYNSPRCPMEACNLTSAYMYQHPHDAKLAKECEAGRMLGPYQSRPTKELKCSGVGTVPNRNGKWRMIHHLSAPSGRSVNDFISKENISLLPRQYCPSLGKAP